MAKRGKGLVARFRRAVQSEEAQRAAEEAAKEQALAAARAARAELLADLQEIGRELELSPIARKGELQLSRGSHRLVFRPDDPDDRVEIDIRFEDMGDETFRLYREPQLDDRWVLTFTRRGRAHRLLFFDQGLEELLILALDLPRPDDADAAAPPTDGSTSALPPGRDL